MNLSLKFVVSVNFIIFCQDFADTIPGHGGIMDRFDCQYLMMTFTNVYIASVVRFVVTLKSLRNLSFCPWTFFCQLANLLILDCSWWMSWSVPMCHSTDPGPMKLNICDIRTCNNIKKKNYILSFIWHSIQPLSFISQSTKLLSFSHRAYNPNKLLHQVMFLEKENQVKFYHSLQEMLQEQNLIWTMIVVWWMSYPKQEFNEQTTEMKWNLKIEQLITSGFKVFVQFSSYILHACDLN